MTESDLKWLFIAMAVMMSAVPMSGAVEKYSANMAKRDIIVACYHAGNKDCPTLWTKIK
jgi:hypothetical protein